MKRFAYIVGDSDPDIMTQDEVDSLLIARSVHLNQYRQSGFDDPHPMINRVDALKRGESLDLGGWTTLKRIL